MLFFSWRDDAVQVEELSQAERKRDLRRKALEQDCGGAGSCPISTADSFCDLGQVT